MKSAWSSDSGACRICGAVPDRVWLPDSIGCQSGTSPYLKGYKDFPSAVLPPEPGVYLRNDIVYYNGDISRTSIGGRIDADINERLVTNIAAPTVVTSATILGGTYAFGATLPLSA